MRSLTFLFVLSTLFVQMSCQNTNNSSATEKFAEHSDDEAFKDAHESPKPLSKRDIRGKKMKFPAATQAGIAYSVPAAEASNKYLFVFHEWWGMNDHILREADRYHEALDGKVNIMAIDLYDGKVTDDPGIASKYSGSADPIRCREIIEAAIKQAGEGAEIATIGWCFGGGWSMQASLMAAEKGAGCVLYYGQPETDVKELASLNADVLGIFAKEDKWITPKVEKEFVDAMKAVGKNVETHSFDADHAFANPSGQRYNEAAATEANKLALNFLKDKLL